MSTSEIEARNRAIAAQNLAADPRASAVVSANAGSGKTHVLINRVTRILLDGVAPEQILCVTYTKAAASEMLNRLFDRLGRFSILADDKLREALQQLDPKAPINAGGLAKARRLFARALETPGGLKIRTIHGFCDTLLRQFPVEAGISPGFTVIEDTDSKNLQAKIIANIGAQAMREPDGPLAASYSVLGELGSGTAPQVFQSAVGNTWQLAEDLLPSDGLEKALAATEQRLEIGPNDTLSTLSAACIKQLPLQQIAEGFMTGSKTNQEQAQDILAALAEPDPVLAFPKLLPAFYTKASGRRAKPISEAAGKYMPELLSLVALAFDEIEYAQQKIWAMKARDNVGAALTLCQAFVGAYQAEKREAGLVDYDDLIHFSHALLTSKLSSQWVLYKMDGNLSHVLVDEAQDNSADQWAVIGALTEEFFAGQGIGDQTRTLFAVGDPKQSIYRFQGADPALFAEQQQRMKTIAKTKGLPVHSPELSLSWRSTPQVLAFIDACFSHGFAPEKKFVGDAEDFIDPGFSNYIEHQAERAQDMGSVSLLPAVPYSSTQPDTDPSRPVNSVSAQHPKSLLARSVADLVADMLARGDAIETDTGKRAVHAGDVLILVRSRNDLFREIIRHLKLQNIPVAGADRMVLQNETAVLDLLSLAKMALQPSDDLSLAEVLKSPFLHPEAQSEQPVDEQILYDLAFSRPKNQSLHEALMASKFPVLDEAKTWVADLIVRAGHENPYRFFSGLLYRRSHTGEAMQRRLLARLGLEAADPVQEFLNMALAFSQKSDGSLLSFVAEMSGRTDIIKREMEEAGSAVRVMTIHGAKGLEAPVVILPDTNSKAGGKTKTGLVEDAGCWLWVEPQSKKCPAIADWQNRQEVLDAQEHRRLLYVALSRARDHLIICGHERGNLKKLGGFPDDSWYRSCEAAFKKLHAINAAKIISDADGKIGYRLGPTPTPMKAIKDNAEIAVPALPNWVLTPMATEPPAPTQQTPSNILVKNEQQVARASPIGAGATDRFLRGNLIHALLEALPDVPPEQQAARAALFLQNQPEISIEQANEIAKVTLQVLRHSQFADLFGPNSRAELPIAGLGAHTVIHGKIDRLVVRDHDVLVLDFKTNRPPPTHIADVPQAYLDQMQVYRELLTQIWPDKTIRCALLWTDGPNLMELPSSSTDHRSV
ncbi:MAG: double-strand break repair helicase AddA [Robiginitomaculum sp.]|nr:double-strand break repair helicase AddA [Robiginitomaculum sp.]